MIRLGVTIPVGPKEHHSRYLDQCLRSVLAQTYPASDIMLIDDMHGLDEDALRAEYGPLVRVWRAPWLLGVAAAFNAGVSLCAADQTLMLGGDDWLDPEALFYAYKCIEARNGEPSYYWYDVQYDDGEQQSLPCNAALVSREFWHKTGGFPPETGCGAPDAALISMMLVRQDEESPMGRIRHIVSPRPMYNVRRHPDQDTASRGPYQGAIHAIRNVLTETWQPPQWGRKAVEWPR